MQSREITPVLIKRDWQNFVPLLTALFKPSYFVFPSNFMLTQKLQQHCIITLLMASLLL